MNYRELNEKTKKWSYPIPKINNILSYLGGFSYFLILNMIEAFWSIPIQEENKEKTAFASQFELWEWNSMLFGLTNAPTTQQHFMDTIFAGLQWHICVNYVDDIVIFLETFEKHVQSLERVLDRLKKNKL